MFIGEIDIVAGLIDTKNLDHAIPIFLQSSSMFKIDSGTSNIAKRCLRFQQCIFDVFNYLYCLHIYCILSSSFYKSKLCLTTSKMNDFS
jgi:hypothetical protein